MRFISTEFHLAHLLGEVLGCSAACPCLVHLCFHHTPGRLAWQGRDLWPPEGGWGPVTLLGQGRVRAGQRQRGAQRQPSRSLTQRAGLWVWCRVHSSRGGATAAPGTCFCHMVGELLPAFHGCSILLAHADRTSTAIYYNSFNRSEVFTVLQRT